MAVVTSGAPALEHRHPLLARLELADDPFWLRREAGAGPVEILGARDEELWVAGQRESDRRSLERATGHPVRMYRATRAELDLLAALRAGFKPFAGRVAAQLVQELPGGGGAEFAGSTPREFERWIAGLPGRLGVSPAQVGEALSLATGVPFVRLDEFAPSRALLLVCGERQVEALRILPMHHDGVAVHYATPGLPTRLQCRQVARVFGAVRAVPLLCSPFDFAGQRFPAPATDASVAALKRTLVSAGVLTAGRLRALEKLLVEAGRSDFPRLLVELGVLTPGRLATLQAEALAMPAEPAPRPDPELCGKLTARMIRALGVVLVRQDGFSVTVATHHPPDPDVEDLILRVTGLNVRWVYSPSDVMRRLVAGNVCAPAGGPPDPLELAFQLLEVPAAERVSLRTGANPWKALASRAGTRPRFVGVAAWAFGVPAVRELPGRLRKTDGDSGALFLAYEGDEAWRPGLEPDEFFKFSPDAAGARAFRPVVVSHSHPNGGRSAPPALIALLDRAEARGELPRGAAEAILLRFGQDFEPADSALLEDGVAPDVVAGWLAEAAGTTTVSLEPTYAEERVIDQLGREVKATRRLDPVDVEVARLLPAATARELGVVPIARQGASVVVAVADPWAPVQDDLARSVDAPIRLVVARRDQIQRAIDRAGGRRMLGQLLVYAGLTAEEVNQAVELSRRQGIRLGQAVISLGFMSELDIAGLVAEQLRLPFIDPEPATLEEAAVKRLPEALCRSHRLVGIHEDAEGLVVAMADPLDTDALAAVGNAYPGPVRRAVATQKAITRVLAEHYDQHYAGVITDELLNFSPEDSARWVLTARQKLVVAVIGAALVGGLIVNWLWTLIALNAVATAVYMAGNVMKLWLMNVSLERRPEVDVTPEEMAAITEDQLPVYTILVPMYREANVLPLLVDGLRRLDYPAAKLDVKLLLEPDDEETIEAARAEQLPPYCEVLIVPEGAPKGKPKACNYGLLHARGEFVVIFDAEDRPDRDQLRKVVAAFKKVPANLVCVQAKLNYFNRRQNLLTRWFTAEYSLWFDLLLPSIYALRGPVPLGGTSNHFITDRLRAAGAWDPYNVTEDADLGLRIHKRGWTTAIVNSTTYEEANSNTYNWIRQRSRWVKGYIQTWLVHMRHPVRLYRQLGPGGFLVFQVMIGGTVMSFLVNPIYWGLTTAWFLGHWLLVEDLFPPVLFYIGATGLYVGNFAFTFASLGGCLRRGYYDEVKYALLTPAYWFLMSVAAWKGLIQLFYKPFYWEKTVHGLHLAGAAEETS